MTWMNMNGMNGWNEVNEIKWQWNGMDDWHVWMYEWAWSEGMLWMNALMNEMEWMKINGMHEWNEKKHEYMKPNEMNAMHAMYVGMHEWMNE